MKGAGKRAMRLIDVKNLRLEIDGRAIVYDVNLHIDAGEIVTLIGPNGAGKSSLVRAMVNILRPSRGQIRRSENLRIGYVPQNLGASHMMPMNVARFLKSWGRVDARQRALIIENYGLEELMSTRLSALSGGEMRRVLFAHALLDAPNLLVLDEATAGLDIHAAARFYEFVARLREEQNMAVLMVSHDLNVVMRASDRVICLNGHICCQGSPLDVSNAPEYAATMGIFDPVALYEHHHDHHHEH